MKYEGTGEKRKKDGYGNCVIECGGGKSGRRNGRRG